VHNGSSVTSCERTAGRIHLCVYVCVWLGVCVYAMGVCVCKCACVDVLLCRCAFW